MIMLYAIRQSDSLHLSFYLLRLFLALFFLRWGHTAVAYTYYPEDQADYPCCETQHPD